MNNKVAKIIKNISTFIYVSGLFGGLVVAVAVVGSFPSGSEAWLMFSAFIFIILVIWLSTFITGSLFLALAEVVFLLQTISNNIGQDIDITVNEKDMIIDNKPRTRKQINYKYLLKIVLVIVSIFMIIGFFIFNNISYKRKLNETWTGNWTYPNYEPVRKRIVINVNDSKVKLCKVMECEEYDVTFEVLKLDSLKFKIEGIEYDLIYSSKDYATFEINGKKIGLKKLSNVYLNQ